MQTPPALMTMPTDDLSGAILRGEASIPVVVVTGFLGSGKTTLLNKLLRHPEMGSSAILVNEYGEIGLDHLLVQEISETIVLLNSGCLCCVVRGDLVDALRDLFIRRLKGEVPPFQRVIVETTGLADPVPIIHTLMTDEQLFQRFRLDGVVATVDATLGETQLRTHGEFVKQVALADRLVLTKLDLADPAEIESLRGSLRELNRDANIVTGGDAADAPDLLFAASRFDPRTKSLDVREWLREEARNDSGHDGNGHASHMPKHRHADDIGTFSLAWDAPLDWECFVRTVLAALAAHGPDILRLKGIINAAGHAEPIVVHGVQHVFYPPTPLPRWPDTDRRSRVVLIVRQAACPHVEALFRAELQPVT